jgi:bifunctional UDP-N-acetylglucosamine pyrophosphorylase/glucosamine-1-phosphate N-acetyltransferase
MGDAVIGRHVTVGAGAITCNYDGYEKHHTTIGDESFIGSDTMLVAPVKLGKRVWTGAGSVIAKDVPAGSLAVERSEQRVVKGYDERKRRSHGGRAPGGKRQGPSGGGSRG